MRGNAVVAVVALCVALLYIGCEKKSVAAKRLVVGNDTLTMERVRLLVPEAAADSVALRQVVRRLRCAALADSGDLLHDSVAGKYAAKMALLMNREYPVEAAGLLLKAALALARRCGPVLDMVCVERLLDSLDATGVASFGPGVVSCRFAGTERSAAQEKGVKSAVKTFEALFAMSDDAASLLVSFITPEPPGVAHAGVKVKGLIADTSVRRSTRGVSTPVRTEDYTRELLMHRPQGSIRDSIARHLSNLQQMYKRQLKTGDHSSGTVWLSFQVDAEGRVVDVRVTRSSIANEQFLERLEHYLKTVRFKAVPPQYGVMKFEFPFEFKAEEE